MEYCSWPSICSYYSIIAGITPPVCPTVYVAAALAKSNWLKTAWVAVRLAPLLYIMPFVFVFDNTFIMVSVPWAILLNVSTAAAGATALASGTMGQLVTKCNIPERLALVASGILLLIPDGRLTYWGQSLFLLFWQNSYGKARRKLRLD